MLAILGVAALLAGQPGVAVRSPYLEIVRHYGPGTEARAMAALHALRLRDPDEVFAELDDKVCGAQGARSCHPDHLIAAGRESQRTVVRRGGSSTRAPSRSTSTRWRRPIRPARPTRSGCIAWSSCG